MKISDIYVSITGYITQDINIDWCRENSQNYMLALPVLNDISKS